MSDNSNVNLLRELFVRDAFPKAQAVVRLKEVPFFEFVEDLKLFYARPLRRV